MKADIIPTDNPAIALVAGPVLTSLQCVGLLGLGFQYWFNTSVVFDY